MKAKTVLLLLVVFSTAYAQHHTIYGMFPTYTAEVGITSKWSFATYSFLSITPFDQITQNTEYPSQTNAFYVELDAIYSLNKQWSLAGSYTYERANPFTDNYRNENRIWAQLQHTTQLGKFRLKNRLRYDFRFIENRTTDQTDFQPRLRYLLGFDAPINKKKTYFAAYNEFFFNTFKNRVATYGENWAFVGIGFPISKKTTLETGLLNISWIRNNQKDWLIQNYWQLTLIQKFRNEN